MLQWRASSCCENRKRSGMLVACRVCCGRRRHSGMLVGCRDSPCCPYDPTRPPLPFRSLHFISSTTATQHNPSHSSPPGSKYTQAELICPLIDCTLTLKLTLALTLTLIQAGLVCPSIDCTFTVTHTLTLTLILTLTLTSRSRLSVD